MLIAILPKHDYCLNYVCCEMKMNYTLVLSHVETTNTQHAVLLILS